MFSFEVLKQYQALCICKEMQSLNQELLDYDSRSVLLLLNETFNHKGSSSKPKLQAEIIHPGMNLFKDTEASSAARQHSFTAVQELL